MSDSSRFSRRVLLGSLPFVPLVYGCGGGGNSPKEAVSRAAAPLVVNGETIAQLRIVQTSPIYDYPTISAPPITSRLIVENTGTRTIADLQFFLQELPYYLSGPVALNALAPGQVYQTEDLFLRRFLESLEPAVSRLRFEGEAARGGPFTSALLGDFTATGDRSATGTLNSVVTVDNKVVGLLDASLDSSSGYSGSRTGPISATIDSAGTVTASLEDNQYSLPSALSGAIRTEGDGLRFEFSVAPTFSGVERFSAFLKRRQA